MSLTFPPNPWTEGTGHVRIRKANSGDVRYITSSWLNSYWNSPANKGIRKSEFFSYEHKLLETILPRATTLVLCNAANEDQILGWVCFEKRSNGVLILHYANIKAPYRGRGLARLLIEEILELEKPQTVLFTYVTSASHKIIRTHNEEMGSWRHNPYLKYALAPQDWYK